MLMSEARIFQKFNFNWYESKFFLMSGRGIAVSEVFGTWDLIVESHTARLKQKIWQ